MRHGTWQGRRGCEWADELDVRFEHNEEQSPMRSLPSICSLNLTWHTIRTHLIAESRIYRGFAGVSLRGKSAPGWASTLHIHTCLGGF
jgi:hypothetical protein